MEHKHTTMPHRILFWAKKLKYYNSSVVGRQGLQALLCWPKHVNKLFFKVAMFMSNYIHRLVLFPVLYMIEYSNRISASLSGSMNSAQGLQNQQRWFLSAESERIQSVEIANQISRPARRPWAERYTDE